MKEFFLEEKGIYYRKNDFIEGKPNVLFVHGVSGSSSAWRKYEQKFENEYNIVTYDIRGHGKSERFNKYGDYAIEKFVDDIGSLISHLNIKKFFIISHSFGTLFSLDFIFANQEKIEAAVFLSPNFNIGARWLGILLAPVVACFEAVGLDSSKLRRRHVDYSKYKNTGDWNIPRMIDDVTNTGLKTYLYCTRQVSTFNRYSMLSKLDVPVLVIHGKKDTIFPARNSLKLAGYIKNLELLILEKSDHILVLNNFEEISKAIEKFIDKNFPSSKE